VSRDRFDPWFWRDQERQDTLRRRRAAEEKARARAREAGRSFAPVKVDGRRNIATTFWGKAWCANLERYGDYETRLPRGRSYVRSGAIRDLVVEPGKVRAVVVGTDLYDVEVSIRPLSREAFREIQRECGGRVGSLVKLLEGELPPEVMEVVTREGTGLFPAPREISFTCSCPDWARMCKHIAAALYGVGARLDEDPRLLFSLREVDPGALAASEVVDWLTLREPTGATVARSKIASVFGIDLVGEERRRYGTRPSTRVRSQAKKSRRKK